MVDPVQLVAAGSDFDAPDNHPKQNVFAEQKKGPPSRRCRQRIWPRFLLPSEPIVSTRRTWTRPIVSARTRSRCRQGLINSHQISNDTVHRLSLILPPFIQSLRRTGRQLALRSKGRKARKLPLTMVRALPTIESTHHIAVRIRGRHCHSKREKKKMRTSPYLE